jgi:hypothetical protein
MFKIVKEYIAAIKASPFYSYYVIDLGGCVAMLVLLIIVALLSRNN